MSDWPKNDWMNQWQALSRQYWDSWQELTREAGSSGGAASMPWHEGFEQWARMFGGAGKQSETVERVLASARSFTAFAQSMIAAATARAGGATPNWADALRGAAIPGAGASLFDNPVAQALREISGQGVKSFEQMMEGVASSFDPSREVRSWLKVPAFGFLREHQEHYQKMAAAFVDYQEQNARYNVLILKASQRGFELFESKLAAREEPGRQIDSLRALYDLWVDAAEEAYAEIALSPEFRDVYGALVNAQMRVRSQVQQEVERIATDFGMPTRSELDSIGQRLHDLRRELRGAGREGTGSLAREVDSLRREVAALKAALARRDAAAPVVAPRRTAASTRSGEEAGERPAKRSGKRRSTKKRAPVAALRADVAGTVRSIPTGTDRATRARSSAKTPAPVLPRSAEVSASRAERKPRKRAGKSIAKIAHSPTRVGHPPASFAERMAAFARAAHAHPHAALASARRRAPNGGR
jgi:class III poly(R)-hydroxyalkanoic acid synthase PhaE subunit